jgi:hypothetical protein
MSFSLQWLWTVMSGGMWHLFDNANFTKEVQEQDINTTRIFSKQTPIGHINNSSYERIGTF